MLEKTNRTGLHAFGVGAQSGIHPDAPTPICLQAKAANRLLAGSCDGLSGSTVIDMLDEIGNRLLVCRNVVRHPLRHTAIGRHDNDVGQKLSGNIPLLRRAANEAYFGIIALSVNELLQHATALRAIILIGDDDDRLLAGLVDGGLNRSRCRCIPGGLFVDLSGACLHAE